MNVTIKLYQRIADGRTYWRWQHIEDGERWHGIQWHSTLSDAAVDALDALEENGDTWDGFDVPNGHWGELREALRDRSPLHARPFAVEEFSSGFQLRHLLSGQVRWLGDGVDALDGNDGPLTPGGEAFCRVWADGLNADVQGTLEAYFPDLIQEKESRT
jgi:hypothetical protein